jgi:hypothetical protein
MGRWTILLAALLSIAAAQTVRADLSVSVGTLNLQQGGSGFVDVTVSGNADPVNAFGFEFAIQPLGQTQSWLQFANLQPMDYLTDPRYLLADDSFDDAGGLAVGSVIEDVVPQDAFVGGDFSADGADRSITSSKLLARLLVTANTRLPPSAGDRFSIALLPTGSSYFSNAAGNRVAFSSSAGAVTITPVPEPGTLCLLVVGALATWARRKLRQRT